MVVVTKSSLIEVDTFTSDVVNVDVTGFFLYLVVTMVSVTVVVFSLLSVFTDTIVENRTDWVVMVVVWVTGVVVVISRVSVLSLVAVVLIFL
jgi:hypothetical protein